MTERPARVPGFTGDRALLPAARPYAARSVPRASAAVLTPQMLPLRPGSVGPLHCNGTCLCVTPEGCPCCHDIPPELLSVRRR
jgi:hypothetical protein